MTVSNSLTTKSIKYIAGIFVFWVVLFQFFLEIDFRLKPGYIFRDLVNIIIIHYHTEVLYTLISIYVPFICAYFCAKFTLITFYKGRKGLVLSFLTLYEIFKYVPPVLPGIILIFIWPDSFYSEFVYILVISVLSVFFYAFILFENLPEEMLINLKSITDIPEKILNSIKWNLIKAGLTRKIRRLHFQIWSLALMYELLNKNFGMGDILYFAMNTKYFSVIIAVTIITALIIYVVNRLLVIQENKYLFINE